MPENFPREVIFVNINYNTNSIQAPFSLKKVSDFRLVKKYY